MVEELTVPGDPALVVRDCGGAAERSVVLLHGLGGNLLHWAEFAPLLKPRYRVIALDLRCHGRSGDGLWNWDALLRDVERVVAHLDLDRPAIVGHSLGGGVAALWATRHPECPGAVDIDGIRAVETALENYVGLEVETARRQRAELTAMFDARAEAMAAPLTDEQYDAMCEDHRRLGVQSRVEMIERSILVDNGARYVRPNTAVAKAFREQMMDTDFFEVFAAAQCPLLVCAATQDMPGTEQFAELLDAQRRGVDRDLDIAERTNPHLRVERIDASHGMVQQRPGPIAELVATFLGGT